MLACNHQVRERSGRATTPRRADGRAPGPPCGRRCCDPFAQLLACERPSSASREPLDHFCGALGSPEPRRPAGSASCISCEMAGRGERVQPGVVSFAECSVPRFSHVSRACAACQRTIDVGGRQAAVRERIARRTPRGSCPWTARSRSTTATGPRAGSPASSWAVNARRASPPVWRRIRPNQSRRAIRGMRRARAAGEVMRVDRQAAAVVEPVRVEALRANCPSPGAADRTRAFGPLQSASRAAPRRDPDAAPPGAVERSSTYRKRPQARLSPMRNPATATACSKPGKKAPISR